MKSNLWRKKDYIRDRTEYWKSDGLSKCLAEECAIEDWYRYCEQYGYDPET